MRGIEWLLEETEACLARTLERVKEASKGPEERSYLHLYARLALLLQRLYSQKGIEGRSDLARLMVEGAADGDEEVEG